MESKINLRSTLVHKNQDSVIYDLKSDYALNMPHDLIGS